MLSVTDVAKDFAAINQRVRPDGSADAWSETTFLENLADLGWHEVEFKIRRSFAYTVLRPDDSEVIGCVYLYPPQDEGRDVDVKLWVTRKAWEEGLDAKLERVVRDWSVRTGRSSGRFGATARPLRAPRPLSVPGRAIKGGIAICPAPAARQRMTAGHRERPPRTASSEPGGPRANKSQ
jgi:hypothetical protein